MVSSAVRLLKSNPTTSITIPQTRGAKRGPPRFFGKTKTQLLDSVMRSNANICFAASLSFFPIFAFYSYRYMTVLKPAREARDAKDREDLLSEGQATA